MQGSGAAVIAAQQAVASSSYRRKTISLLMRREKLTLQDESAQGTAAMRHSNIALLNQKQHQKREVDKTTTCAGDTDLASAGPSEPAFPAVPPLPAAPVPGTCHLCALN